MMGFRFGSGGSMPTDTDILQHLEYLRNNPNMQVLGEDVANRNRYYNKLKRSALDTKFSQYALGKDNNKGLTEFKQDLNAGKISLDEYNRAVQAREWYKTNKQPVLDAAHRAQAGDVNSEWLDRTRSLLPDETTQFGKDIRDEYNTRAANMSAMGAGPTSTWRTAKGAGGTWVPTPGGQYLYQTPEGNRYTYDQVMNPNNVDYYKDAQNALGTGDWNAYDTYKAQMEANNPNFNYRAARQSWQNQFPDQKMDPNGIPKGVPMYPTRPAGGGLEGQMTNWSSNWGGASTNNAYGAGNAGFFGSPASGVFGGLGANGKLSAPTTGGIYGIPTTGGFSGTPGNKSTFSTTSKSPTNLKVGGMVGGQQKMYSKLNGCAIKGKTKGKLL